jgi:hypothetical protein
VKLLPEVFDEIRVQFNGDYALRPGQQPLGESTPARANLDHQRLARCARVRCQSLQHRAFD